MLSLGKHSVFERHLKVGFETEHKFVSLILNLYVLQKEVQINS